MYKYYQWALDNSEQSGANSDSNFQPHLITELNLTYGI